MELYNPWLISSQNYIRNEGLKSTKNGSFSTGQKKEKRLYSFYEKENITLKD